MSHLFYLLLQWGIWTYSTLKLVEQRWVIISLKNKTSHFLLIVTTITNQNYITIVKQIDVTHPLLVSMTRLTLICCIILCPPKDNTHLREDFGKFYPPTFKAVWRRDLSNSFFLSNARLYPAKGFIQLKMLFGHGCIIRSRLYNSLMAALSAFGCILTITC